MSNKLHLGIKKILVCELVLSETENKQLELQEKRGKDKLVEEKNELLEVLKIIDEERACIDAIKIRCWKMVGHE